MSPWRGGTSCSWRTGPKTAKRVSSGNGKEETQKRSEPALKPAWALHYRHYSRHAWSSDPVLICKRKPPKASVPTLPPSTKADTLQMGKEEKREGPVDLPLAFTRLWGQNHYFWNKHSGNYKQGNDNTFWHKFMKKKSKGVKLLGQEKYVLCWRMYPPTPEVSGNRTEIQGFSKKKKSQRMNLK